MENTLCNLCGVKDSKCLYRGIDRLLHTTDRIFTVVKCTNCGLVRLSPRPTQKEIGTYYPANYSPYSEDPGVLKEDWLSSLLQRKQKPSSESVGKDSTTKTYLDFGCGGGSQLERARYKHPHWKLYGLDTSPTACKRTREKGFEVFCDSAQKANLPSNFFDYINMSHVVEHLHDPKGTLKILYKSLKNGGEIVLSTPNVRSLGASIFKSYWYGADVPRHLFLFSPKTLTSLLESVGFRVSSVRFNDGPKVEIRSIYYVLGKKDLRIPKTLWKLARPWSILLSHFGLSSIMTITARKTETSE